MAKLPLEQCAVTADACRHCLRDATRPTVAAPNAVVGSMVAAAGRRLDRADLQELGIAIVRSADGPPWDIPRELRRWDELPSKLPRADLAERLRICDGCDRRINNHCRECGCDLAQRLRLPAFRCPLGKLPGGVPLTIGMACYDDCQGVVWTVKSLQLHHAAALAQCEILVVDNHPDSEEGRRTRDFLAQVPGARYIPLAEPVGTAAPRDRIFREAAGSAVLCLDSHVMLEAGSLQAILDYWAANGESRDMLQGPLLGDGAAVMATDMAERWGDVGGMFGVWQCDDSLLSDASPKPIRLHGLGLFSMRRAAWPGFNPHFRGFGGEEGYIHEKVRRAGGQTIFLPSAKWWHWFGRRGQPYPNLWEDRARNYFLGRIELDDDCGEVYKAFAPYLSRDKLHALHQEAFALTYGDGERVRVHPAYPQVECCA